MLPKGKTEWTDPRGQVSKQAGFSSFERKRMSSVCKQIPYAEVRFVTLVRREGRKSGQVVKAQGTGHV